MLNLSNKRMIEFENQFDEKKQDCLVQKFGLRRLQRFDAIQAESPFLLFFKEDKKRLSSQVVMWRVFFFLRGEHVFFLLLKMHIKQCSFEMELSLEAIREEL